MCQLMTYITCDSSIYIHLIYTLFYTYLEHFANKGSDKVCIFLFDFIVNNLNVVHIFCDSACGWNKNSTIYALCSSYY